jgi:microcystin-dependent protein
MKKSFLILAFLCISVNFFSQGISVQGIARNNDNSAMIDRTLDFIFYIAKADKTVLYSETQKIKTDIFGVFSHIVSQGNPQDNASFQNVDFSLENLRLKVTASLGSNVFEVYNQPFQYTPYAHFAKRAKNADDGVPTGAIMPFVGTVAPAGWVFCWGQNIVSVEGSANLIDLLGNGYAPDLKGMFLRGAGVTTVSKDKERLTYVGPDLMKFQEDSFEKHRHEKGTLKNTGGGGHSHKYKSAYAPGSYEPAFSTKVESDNYTKAIIKENETSPVGNHTHPITGATSDTGDTETRPANYGVHYIIKL